MGQSASPPEKPTGTVTFMFTDIEGSTVRWDAHPQAMQEAVRRHDALMRAAIERNRGYVFHTIGDAFCAAFSSARDGVAGALAAQNTLAAEDFSAVDGMRVRIALHVGVADERDGDYFGGTVNRVARLLAVAHGGQILLSNAAHDAVADKLPMQATLLDLGTHRLRDLSEAEQIFQLAAPGLKEEFPELKSLDVLPNNLPAQTTPLIGRDEEVRYVETLLQQARMVTLAGPGGIGKTRVALQIAADLLEADGAWFVDLAPVAEPASLPSALAEVFGVRDSGTRPLIDSVATALKKKKLLVVLDNCEHLISAAADAADLLLRHCPDVRVLATSREPLAVPGEEVFRMPTLAVPPSSQAIDVRKLTDYAAPALFVARAQAARRDFRVDDASAPVVVEIVRRLDGIALAIELAAARVKVLSVQQLLEKLDERFKLLTGGSRTVLPRQQTLRALIGWSYGLLSDDEKRAFRRMSIFAGGFTLELAIAVCASEACNDYEVLDRLTSLVDKSLVAVEPIEPEVRYRFLESMREFASEKLIENNEFDDAAAAHTAALAALAEILDAKWRENRDSEEVARSKRELDNWRAALRWSLSEKKNVALGQRLAAALRFAWSRFGPAEGRIWIARALAAEVPPPDVLAKLHLSDAHLAMLVAQDRAALSAAKRALALLEGGGDPQLTAEAQLIAGVAAGRLGSADPSEVLLRDALDAFRSLGSTHDAASALQGLGVLSMNAGDLDAARAYYAQAQEAYEIVGAKAAAAHMALNLAEAEFQSGDAARALELAVETLSSDRARGDDNNAVHDLCNIAAYELALDRAKECITRAYEALSMAKKAGNDTGFGMALQHLAAAAALHSIDATEGRASCRQAARLLGFVDRRFEDLGYVREYTEQQEYERATRTLDETIGAAARSALMLEGANCTDDWAMQAASAIHLNG